MVVGGCVAWCCRGSRRQFLGHAFEYTGYQGGGFVNTITGSRLLRQATDLPDFRRAVAYLCSSGARRDNVSARKKHSGLQCLQFEPPFLNGPLTNFRKLQFPSFSARPKNATPTR